MAGLSLSTGLGLALRRAGDQAPTINQSGPLIIAHRCSSAVYPEFSDRSFEWAYDAGIRQLEIDGRILSDGAVGVMHDATVDRTTDGTGNVAALDAAAFQALNVDYASWFSGDYGALHPPLAFNVIDQLNGKVALHIEGKDVDAMTAIVSRLIAIGARKDQYVLSSFQLTVARVALNAGFNAAVVAGAASDMEALWTEGFRWVSMPSTETDALVQQYVARGFNVLVYTLERRKDRDKYIGLGVRGLYSDDAQYTAGNAPIATRDAWADQRWMPGMLWWQNRGKLDSGWWGWPDYVGVAGCLQGWACPINGREDANDFSIDFEARFHAAGAGTDWFGVWIADASMRDQIYTDTGAPGQKGYFILFRQSGRIQVYRRTETASINVFADGPAFTVDGTTPNKVRVRVTPTQVIGERLDTSGWAVTSAVMTDDMYRGGYVSINKVSNARAMFRNFNVRASSEPALPVYDARAKAVFDFWEGVGAAPSMAVKSLYNDTIVALQDFGIWPDADLLAFTAATNMIHGVTDLKNPEASKIFSLSNSPTWTDRYGWTGNGTSSYVGTWLTPATNGVRWTVNDAGVWTYTDTDLAASVPDAGAGETFSAFCIPRGSTGSMGGQINRVSGATTLATVASSAGLTGISRIDATAERIWRDGIQQAEATVSAAGRPTGQFRICGRSPSIFSTRRVGFVMAGASCAGKEANLNAVVQDFITRIKVVAA